MLARVTTAAFAGIEGFLVEVETDIAPGLPYFSVVGLPDAAVRESRERVAAAIKNSGFEFPVRKITVNLAPAGVRKEGARYDLPIAIGILLASGQVEEAEPDGLVMLGELSLDGGRDEFGDFVRLRFVLPPGCYATAVLAEIQKQPATAVE